MSTGQWIRFAHGPVGGPYNHDPGAEKWKEANSGPNTTQHGHRTTQGLSNPNERLPDIPDRVASLSSLSQMPSEQTARDVQRGSLRIPE
jgi:hypothetical protein